MRNLAVVVALICLTALLITLRPCSEDSAPPAAEDEAPVRERPTPAPVPDAPGAIDPEAPVDPAPEAAPVPDPSGERKVKVTGTVVVTNTDGPDHAALDGAFDYLTWQGQTAGGGRARVKDGRWSVEVPEGTRLQIGQLELGGRTAILRPEFRKKIPVEPGREIALRADWFQPTRLHVLAGDLGVPLTGVEIIYSQWWDASDRPHPGEAKDARVRGTTGASPIDLPRTPHHGAGQTIVYHVRAAGYAWGRIELDPTGGGERTIRLVRSGDLTVRIRATRIEDGTLLCIRSTEQWEPFFQTEVRARTEISVESLPPGMIEVFLVVGEWGHDATILARNTARIVAGQGAEVLLEPEETTPVERVPMAGEIRVPSAWELPGVSIEFELLDTPRDGHPKIIRLLRKQLIPAKGREGVFLFDAGEVQPGRYEVRIDEVAWVTSLRLPDRGASDLVFDVPPPARISVRVVDEHTGTDADVENIFWHVAWPEWVSGGTLNDVPRDPKTKRFEFRAPRGRVVICRNSDLYGRIEKAVETGPDTTRVEVTVRRACGFVVRLKDGDTPVAWTWAWDLRAEEVDGEGRATLFSIPDGAHRVGVTSPGTYRVWFPKIEGYRPIPDREIVIRPGGFAEVTVELERED